MDGFYIKMKKIKILHIGLDENLGGIERFLFNLYNNIDDNYYMDFITVAKKLPYNISDFILKNKKYKIFHISGYKNILKYCIDLRKIVKDNYDIIHIHKNSLANILPVVICCLFGNAKVIVHSHNSQASGNKFVAHFLHRVNRKLISFFPITKVACSEIAGKWMFNTYEYQVIHNAIDVKKFSFDNDVRNTMRNALNLNGKFVIGSVARISDQKNQIFMVKIMKKVVEMEPTAQLLLIGEAAFSKEGQLYQKNLIDTINEEGLRDSIKLLGRRNDAEKLYQAFDVIFMPSKYEGLSIAAIEAQAADLPIIASDNISNETKIIKDYYTYSLNDNYDIWAKKLLSFKNRKRFNNEKTIISAGYGIKQEVENIEKLYLKVMKGD